MAHHNEDSNPPTEQAHAREDVPVSQPVPHPSILPPKDVTIQLHLPSPTNDIPQRQPIRHLYVR